MTATGRFTRVIWGDVEDVAAPIEARAAATADANLTRLKAEVPAIAQIFHAITFTAALDGPQPEHELINAYVKFINLPYPGPDYRGDDELLAGIPARRVWPESPLGMEHWVTRAVQWAYAVEEPADNGWSLIVSGWTVQAATPTELAPHLLIAWAEAVPDAAGLRVCFWPGLNPYSGLPEHIITTD